MIKNTILLIVLMSIIFSSCKKDRWPCIKGRGVVTTEQRAVAGFSRVILETEGTLHVTQGNDYKVELSAQPNILDHLVTEVRDGELHIYSKRCIRKTNALDYYITMPEIEGLSVSGSGQIFVSDTIDVGNLNLSVSGSGNMNVIANAVDIDATISGSGNLNLTGGCQTQSVTVSGSGNVSSYSMPSEDCHTTISGSGHAGVFVYNRMWVVISGSGSVSYKGNPSLEQVSISGSGALVNDN